MFGKIKTQLFILCFCMLSATFAFADETATSLIPVPKNIIYAGQIVSPNLLRNRKVPVSYLNRFSVISQYSEVVGKVAKVTLVPSKPIPTNYLSEPDIVKVNKRTVIHFRSGALLITAEVMPLNAAKVGDSVRARNIQTGVIVHGVAQANGTILAGAYK
jgi:flagella basal body P-ring formation protein FlgA